MSGPEIIAAALIGLCVLNVAGLLLWMAAVRLREARTAWRSG